MNRQHARPQRDPVSEIVRWHTIDLFLVFLIAFAAGVMAAWIVAGAMLP